MLCYSLGSRQRSQWVRRALFISVRLRAWAASIPMPPPCPTSIRIYSRKVPIRAKASMPSTPLKPHWLAERPNSTLLSHDLFEGVFARAGLASDVEVVEAYPTRYDVAALRYHRWARGDWQLLPWILGWNVLFGEARRRSAMMPASGRWKMVDNLRRTSSPITCLLALTAGWLLPFDAAVIWTLFVFGTIALPSFTPVLAATVVSTPCELKSKPSYPKHHGGFPRRLLQSC